MISPYIPFGFFGGFREFGISACPWFTVRIGSASQGEFSQVYLPKWKFVLRAARIRVCRSAFFSSAA
jgi:hypothetical protein